MVLEERWKLHCASLGSPADVTDRYWTIIESRYTEKQRFYHTLDHIAEMFQHFDDVKDKLSQPDHVALAIFFHDIIYDPTKSDNEERSADLFTEFSESCPSLKDNRKKIEEWILETKLHQTDAHRSRGEYGSHDVHYFLDMDMAVLGTPLTDYNLYAEKIRSEYSHYPPVKFNQGRAQVLRKFLTIPNIFATQEFRNKYEQRARENINTEIRRLDTAVLE